ncbi:transposase [Dyella japonica DSM 16301]|uniref:Transposase n=1 Tax=Dyella japonica DSM 16301 TaxID=1440762 RepID=A0A0G9H418_9GAMM|nr:transposase [Dyella japonica DSM 16301]
MTKQKYSKEVRERAVRMVREHQPDHPSEWVTTQSVAAKLGCTPQTLHNWVRKAQVEAGQRECLTVSELDRMKTLERENRELRQANEILRKASAYFAEADLGRRFKP